MLVNIAKARLILTNTVDAKFTKALNLIISEVGIDRARQIYC